MTSVSDAEKAPVPCCYCGQKHAEKWGLLQTCVKTTNVECVDSQILSDCQPHKSTTKFIAKFQMQVSPWRTLGAALTRAKQGEAQAEGALPGLKIYIEQWGVWHIAGHLFSDQKQTHTHTHFQKGAEHQEEDYRLVAFRTRSSRLSSVSVQASQLGRSIPSQEPTRPIREHLPKQAKNSNV